LMIMCILVVSIFRSTTHIANAYGQSFGLISTQSPEKAFSF
jgi:hypothetical protein